MQSKPSLRILENPDEIKLVEALQRLVWPGDETSVVPSHLMKSAVQHGGLLIGAFTENETEQDERLVGFVFGFPGLYNTPDGPRLMHYSHMLGIHPDYRNQGLGYLLKRAQWQIVRHQELDRIVWTYDPLLSPNAYLNITKLGAVCNTYIRNYYGEMNDGLNLGLPSDRFQVDWWINTVRVSRRLSHQPRPPLNLDHYQAAQTEIINPAQFRADGFPIPGEKKSLTSDQSSIDSPNLLMVEIPANFLDLKAADQGLGMAWRLHIRDIFEACFSNGYLVTDFIHRAAVPARSYYVLSYGESTL